MCTDKTVHVRETNHEAWTASDYTWTNIGRWVEKFDRFAINTKIFCLRNNKARHRQTRTKKSGAGLTMSGLICLNRMSKIHQDGTHP